MIVSSADGSKLAGAVWGGGIYNSQTQPAPQLNLAHTNGAFALSWILPSTNFVLQQNLDLATTNWTILTNLPVLNFASLENKVTVSPTNDRCYFRLVSQ